MEISAAASSDISSLTTDDISYQEYLSYYLIARIPKTLSIFFQSRINEYPNWSNLMIETPVYSTIYIKNSAWSDPIDTLINISNFVDHEACKDCFMSHFIVFHTYFIILWWNFLEIHKKFKTQYTKNFHMIHTKAYMLKEFTQINYI